MSNLNLGTATPPPPQLVVTRGSSTLANPKTAVAERCWNASHAPLSSDLSTLTLIPFGEIRRRLLLLNPRMLFRDLGDGRIIIGVDHPTPGSIAEYEDLSYYERKEIDAPHVRETPGPRVWLIAASSNVVDKDTELVSRSRPQFTFTPDPLGGPDLCSVTMRPPKVICRALTTIIRACVDGDAFTLADASRIFGIPFATIKTRLRYLDMTPAEWHTRATPALTV